SFEPHVTVGDFDLHSGICGETLGNFFRDSYRTVFPAGATERQCCIVLIFGAVPFDDRFHHSHVAVYKRCDTFTLEYIVRDLLVLTGKWPQFWHPVWVGDETNISNIVRVLWDAIFESERHDIEPNNDWTGFGK